MPFKFVRGSKVICKDTGEQGTVVDCVQCACGCNNYAVQRFNGEIIEPPFAEEELELLKPLHSV